MWIKTEKKTETSLQELRVKALIAELCDYNFDADRFIREFKEGLRKIPRTNTYQAEHLYKAIAIDTNSIEIYKMKANADKNYLMYSLSKGEDKPCPFGHL